MPCVVFQGDPLAAWDYSAVANKKTTVALTTTERSNATWKRVCLSWRDGGWITSKADLLALGLSKSYTISQMRRALIALLEQGLPEGGDPMDLTWMEADRLYKDHQPSDSEPQWDDDEENPNIQDWADRLNRTFGMYPVKSPETFLLAMERYSPKLVADLTDYLRDAPDDF